jgi:hypothetical protein
MHHEFGPIANDIARVRGVRRDADAPCPGPERALAGEQHGAWHAAPAAYDKHVAEVPLVGAAAAPRQQPIDPRRIDPPVFKRTIGKVRRRD